MSQNEKNPNNKASKVLLAALAGTGAGLLAGILLAPAKGKATRQSLEGMARKYSSRLGGKAAKIGAGIDAVVNETVGKLEDLGLAGTGAKFQLKGDWKILKGKLQQEYAHLTDDDLAYVEGKGDELVGRLEAKLGKSRPTIIKILNAL